MNKTNITEDYVSFEVAKLLKRKGFNEATFNYYTKEGRFENSINYCNDYVLANFNKIDAFNEIPENLYSAPTLQMTLKWLREIHNLHIDVFIGITADDSCTYWTYFITDLKGNMIFSAYGDDMDFKGENYEQTIESAIKCCLTELIK